MNAPTLPNDLDVWILAGQSNMEGGGLLRDGLPPNNRVWSFSPGGKWEVASEPLHRPWESYTENHPALLRSASDEAEGKSNQEMATIARLTQVTGAGLGLAFGLEMMEQTGRSVGLIPCAHGGSSLQDWSHSGQTTSDLYGGLLDRVRRAMDSGGSLRGLLWYQGESDTNPSAATAYADNFSLWVEALRADLDSPELPIHLVQLGRLISTPTDSPSAVASLTGWEILREAQRGLPSRIAQCHVTSAIDLGLHDTIHLDGASLIRLGVRLARLAAGEAAPSVSSIVRDREEEQIRGGRGVIQICCNTHGSTWKKLHPLSGFTLHDPAGLPHPRIVLIQAEVAGNDPTALRLITNILPDDSLRVGYGLGFNPFCNVVTERDLPLPAFLPQALA